MVSEFSYDSMMWSCGYLCFLAVVFRLFVVSLRDVLWPFAVCLPATAPGYRIAIWDRDQELGSWEEAVCSDSFMWREARRRPGQPRNELKPCEIVTGRLR